MLYKQGMKDRSVANIAPGRRFHPFTRTGDMNSRLLLLFSSLLLLVISSAPAFASAPWAVIAQGVEYAVFNGQIHVVRLDPSRAKLVLLLASEQDKRPRTTGAWCKDFNLIAAINAGMYGTDYSTNVGYLRNGTHVQNGRWSGRYKSALAFDPLKPGLPQAVIVDLDEPGAKDSLKYYRSVVQNLRLMKKRGVNVWPSSDKRWSEAAVGMDSQGRILFLFCRTPYPMKEFNELVKSLQLGVIRMMHVEGGSEASLSVNAGGFTRDLAGTFDVTTPPGDSDGEQWPIPNVIGIQK